MKIPQCTRIYLTLFMLLTSIMTHVWAGCLCIKPTNNSSVAQEKLHSELIDALFLYSEEPSVLMPTLQHYVESGADVNKALSTTALGRSAWLNTIGSGHVDVIGLLLNNGADPNATFACKIFSPLHMIVSCIPGQARTNIFNALIHSGANVDQRDLFKQTPLVYSVKNNDLEMARALINNGANVNATSFGNQSLLYIAAKKGFAGMVSLLLKNGANMSDSSKCKLLSLANTKGHLAVIDVLKGAKSQ